MDKHLVKIRREHPSDFPAIDRVIQKAFEGEEFSDQTEQYLVENLRRTNAYIPELALVAEYEEEVIGHIMLTKIKIKGEGGEYTSLALAPVTVLPKYQHRGVGGMLMESAHEAARDAGYQSIILVGHADYYPRFGYEKASHYGLTLPFGAPDENCLALELVEGALDGVSGEVEYSSPFYE